MHPELIAVFKGLERRILQKRSKMRKQSVSSRQQIFKITDEADAHVPHSSSTQH